MADSILEYEAQRIGVEALVRKYRGILFDAAGLIQFGPMLLLLLMRASERVPAEWAIGLGCGALWLLARLALPSPLRFRVMTCAGLILLGSPLLINPVGSPPFVPITTVSFAIVLAGIIAYRARWSLVIIAVTAALLGLIGISGPPAALIPGGALDIQLSVLLCVIAGAGILITKIEFVRLWRASDVRTRRALRQAERGRRAQERVLARTAAERRVHETVLNTLTAISMGVGIDRPEEIRQACTLDLQQLDEIPGPLPQSSASAAVWAAVDTARDFGVTCEVTGESSNELDMFTTWALRDAVTEALLNVSRHSGVSRADISITAARDTTVAISDEGRGLDSSGRESFGLRSSIRRSLLDVGGEASIDSGPGRGTTVTLRVPHGQAEEGALLKPHRLDSTASLLARLGLLGTLVVLVLGAPLIAENLDASYLLPVLATGALVVGIGLSILWQSPWRIPLAVASLVFLGLMYGSTFSLDLQCSAAPGFAWLLALAGGGGALSAIIAPSSPAGRMTVIVTVTLMGAFALTALPSACRTPAVLPLATNAIYLASVWLVMRWGDRTMLVEREAANDARLITLSQRLEAERSAAALDGWSSVDPDTRAFLSSVASGHVDPADDSSQAVASRLASAIRSRIGLMDRRALPQGLAEALTEIGRGSGARIEFGHMSDFQFDAPLPPELQDYMATMLSRLGGATVNFNVVESAGNQIIVARTDWDALSAVADAPQPSLPAGYAFSLYRDPVDPTIACLLIERPIPA